MEIQRLPTNYSIHTFTMYLMDGVNEWYEHIHTHMQFSPIAEVEEEDLYAEERSKHKDIGRKKSNSPKYVIVFVCMCTCSTIS